LSSLWSHVKKTTRLLLPEIVLMGLRKIRSFLGRNSLNQRRERDCVRCRRQDSHEVRVRIGETVLSALDSAGISSWRFEGTSQLRFLVSEENFDAASTVVENLADEATLALKIVTSPLKVNQYEFDSAVDIAPEEDRLIKIWPAPHCGVGRRFLRLQGVTLESVRSDGERVVLGKGGKGPRVISRTELDTWSSATTTGSATAEWPFDIDLVYTWVDQDDFGWQTRRASRAADESNTSNAKGLATNASRFYSRDELRYSLRSVRMYAPFIRKIWIVTDGQKPDWLVEDDMVQVVSHADLYPNSDDLPTFNSSGIETVLHNIPGLAEHFLYLNDDFFFSKPVDPNHFFSIGGLTRVYHSERFLDRLPVKPSDRPTVAGHKNSRALIEEKTGIRLDQKFFHAPYVYRKSVLAEMEEAFPDAFERTRANPFRNTDDIIVTFLYQNYALARGYAFPSRIDYKYFELLTAPDDFLDVLSRGNQAVFCVNDTAGVDATVADRDVPFSSWLATRFPHCAPWEKNAGKSDETTTTDEPRTSFEATVRDMGLTEASDYFLRNINNTRTARKAVDFFFAVGKTNLALGAISHCGLDPNASHLKALALRSQDPDTTTADLVDHVQSIQGNSAKRHRAMSQLVKTVHRPEDFAVFSQLMEDSFPHWSTSLPHIKLMASTARRGGNFDLAKELLIEAAHRAQRSARHIDNRRESQSLSSGPEALVDFLDALGELQEKVFLDAGTLLGAIREGKLIDHDYDIDFGTQDPDSFKEIEWRLRKDWRFTVRRIRTPEKLIDVRHISGVSIDLFLHRWNGDFWIKDSHVYGWKFTDYALRPTTFLNQSVMIPDSPETYLTQMYGDDWGIPQSGFDSRIDAPNCFFPSQDEIICTQLGKIVAAAEAGDEAAVASRIDILSTRFGYAVTL